MSTGEQTPPDALKDLGFGSVVVRQGRFRLLNRDGTFNVDRVNLGIRGVLNLYQDLITTTWPRFLLLVAALYVVINVLFGLAYFSLGEEALQGGDASGPFGRAFFFSVHTLSTVGYGSITPHGIGANALMTVESLCGLLLVALVTGISFARFARPNAEILFSDNALIAPFGDGSAFQFRLVNLRRSQLLDVQVRVIFSRRQDAEPTATRTFHDLPLERDQVAFFPLTWTVVHPIEKESPLFGMGARELVECDAEFFVLLQGLDETFSTFVHARTSYTGEEVVCGARFANVFIYPEDDEGTLSVDVGRLHDYEPWEALTEPSA